MAAPIDNNNTKTAGAFVQPPKGGASTPPGDMMSALRERLASRHGAMEHGKSEKETLAERAKNIKSDDAEKPETEKDKAARLERKARFDKMKAAVERSKSGKASEAEPSNESPTPASLVAPPAPTPPAPSVPPAPLSKEPGKAKGKSGKGKSGNKVKKTEEPPKAVSAPSAEAADKEKSKSESEPKALTSEASKDASKTKEKPKIDPRITCLEGLDKNKEAQADVASYDPTKAKHSVTQKKDKEDPNRNLYTLVRKDSDTAVESSFFFRLTSSKETFWTPKAKGTALLIAGFCLSIIGIIGMVHFGLKKEDNVLDTVEDMGIDSAVLGGVGLVMMVAAGIYLFCNRKKEEVHVDVEKHLEKRKEEIATLQQLLTQVHEKEKGQKTDRPVLVNAPETSDEQAKRASASKARRAKRNQATIVAE